MALKAIVQLARKVESEVICFFVRKGSGDYKVIW